MNNVLYGTHGSHIRRLSAMASRTFCLLPPYPAGNRWKLLFRISAPPRPTRAQATCMTPAARQTHATPKTNKRTGGGANATERAERIYAPTMLHNSHLTGAQCSTAFWRTLWVSPTETARSSGALKGCREKSWVGTWQTPRSPRGWGTPGSSERLPVEWGRTGLAPC